MATQRRNWVALWVIGTINNLGYVVCNSAASDLAKTFHARNLLPLIPWANVGLGFFSRGFNTFFLERTSFTSRMIANTTLLIVGLLVLAVSVYVNFWFALLGVLCVGTSSNFGESVLLGFMRRFPPEMVGSWSSGTGMAGVAGSALYLALVSIHMSDQQIFLSLLPFSVIYITTFICVLRPSNPAEIVRGGGEEIQKSLLDGERSGEELRSTPDIDANESMAVVGTETVTAAADPINVEKEQTSTSMERYIRCYRLVRWKALQLGLVYFFEYVISTAAADKAQEPDYKDSKKWEVRHAYEILSFCYQFGVLLSRSSLALVKISKIEFLTFVQGVNFALWLLIDRYKFVDVYWQVPLMIFVGLLGGAMYVNVFYLLLHDATIPEEDRELCVNLTALAITAGITLACVFGLIMDQTFLRDY